MMASSTMPPLLPTSTKMPPMDMSTTTTTTKMLPMDMSTTSTSTKMIPPAPSFPPPPVPSKPQIPSKPSWDVQERKIPTKATWDVQERKPAQFSEIPPRPHPPPPSTVNPQSRQSQQQPLSDGGASSKSKTENGSAKTTGLKNQDKNGVQKRNSVEIPSFKQASPIGPALKTSKNSAAIKGVLIILRYWV